MSWFRIPGIYPHHVNEKVRPLDVGVERNANLVFEKDANSKVIRFWKANILEFRRNMQRSGQPPDFQAVFGERLYSLLWKHYRAVSQDFKGVLGARLPKRVAPTPNELRAIEAALRQGLPLRARAQAEIINATTQRNATEALGLARANTVQMAREGVQRSVQEEAAEASRLLSRRLAQRTPGISSLETQAAAELAKQTEAEILLGNDPSITGGNVTEAEIFKTWWSQGDDIVREDHLMADQQEQLLGDAFQVGPDRLLFPGDTSYGAPVSQVINCRCASVIEEADVAKARRRRGLGK